MVDLGREICLHLSLTLEFAPDSQPTAWSDNVYS